MLIWQGIGLYLMLAAGIRNFRFFFSDLVGCRFLWGLQGESVSCNCFCCSPLFTLTPFGLVVRCAGEETFYNLMVTCQFSTRLVSQGCDLHECFLTTHSLPAHSCLDGTGWLEWEIVLPPRGVLPLWETFLLAFAAENIHNGYVPPLPVGAIRGSFLELHH